ncbi:hypothetical protein MHW47_02720 [Streptomyces sp. OfavH-34-F]|uniref:hypothetical protein n=1 Tax=Streptomyces sp. OfavH-34-F TaxID=2917760 RepID=UPI001EF164D5|nr:hypothetical protein [Streptomyces sp. OfavH-34-F]MCG7523361.1 hypothetical protein [Streptomyces sp. OfavH-34-F]
MSAQHAWVGDLVRDGDGRRSIVTDVHVGRTVWVLRPPTGGGPHWETDDPDSLELLTRSEARDSW